MTCTEPIALLKRSDVELFFFHSGADWRSKADGLGEGHCFDVVPLLIVPFASATALQHISAALKQTSVGSGWFACTAGVAAGALAAVALATASPGAVASAAHPDAGATEAAAESAPTTAAAGSAEELAAIATDPECSDEASGGMEEGIDNALWDLVEPCATAQASKAGDVRASLQASFGKHEASRLLANTKASVARGADGHKFRMLRLGGHALKLKAG